MTIIAPSLLSCNFLNIESELSELNKSENLWIHLDVMDGHFVPNLTFGPPVISKMAAFTKHPLDAHLMVYHPELYFDSLSAAGVYNLTFHWEAVTHHDRILNLAKSKFKSVGISLNPSTTAEIIPDYLLKKLDLILIMSVNPGFGGQSYISGVEEKVTYLKAKKTELNAHFQIQFDGGVSDANAQHLRSIGVDNLVAGSFIFNSPTKNYQTQIVKLLS